MAKKNVEKPEKLSKPVKISKAEELQEQFEAELDIALLYMFEIFYKHKKVLNTFLDYEGDYDDGPSFQITVNADKKGKLESADIHLEFKNMDTFIKNMKE